MPPGLVRVRERAEVEREWAKGLGEKERSWAGGKEGCQVERRLVCEVGRGIKGGGGGDDKKAAERVAEGENFLGRENLRE